MPRRKSKVPKERIGGYLRAEVVTDLRALLDTLPRSVTISDVMESAIEREVRRIKRVGWTKRRNI